MWSLTLTESGSYSRTLPSSETQSGTFDSRDTEAHSFSYYGVGLYSSSRGAAFLGGHADWSGGADDSTLSAAGGRSGSGTNTFTASGNLTIPAYTLGTVDTLSLVTTAASAAGSVSVTDSFTFAYAEGNYDVAVAHSTDDYFYGIFDATDRTATDSALQAYNYNRAGQSTYGKSAAIAGGANGSLTLKDIDVYQESTLQMRNDSDSTQAVRLDGEHVTAASHLAAGSLAHVSADSYSHSFTAQVSYTFASGSGSGSMTLTELGTLSYKLTDAYGYTDRQNRLDERSWSVGTTVPTVTTSFVVHNTQKDQSGVLWQSESGGYSYLLTAYTESSSVWTGPFADGSAVMGVPNSDGMNFGEWGGDGAMATGAGGGGPSGVNGVQASAYTGWFAEHTTFTKTGTFSATETYNRVDYNNLLSNYDLGTATFGFEDATVASPATVVNAEAYRTDTNVVSKTMTNTADRYWPLSYSGSHQDWTDRELDTGTAASASFSIGGVSTVSGSPSVTAAFSQDYTRLLVPAASYYVLANIAETEGATIGTTSGSYVDVATYSVTENQIFNPTIDSLHYGDVADYSSLSGTFGGFWYGTRNDEHISHTLESTSVHETDSTWDVYVTKSQAGPSLTARYSGTGTTGTTTISEYLRIGELYDYVLPPCDIDVHYTHWKQSGVHINDRMQFYAQRQNWNTDAQTGVRDGSGDWGEFDGGDFGDDSGTLGGDVLGGDSTFNGYRERGNRHIRTIYVSWTDSNATQQVYYPGGPVWDWDAPGYVGTASGSGSQYVNNSGYVGEILLHDRGGARYHPHTSTGYSTALSGGSTITHTISKDYADGSGHFSVSHQISGVYVHHNAGSASTSLLGDTGGGHYSASSYGSATANGERTGVHRWMEDGSTTFHESTSYTDGVYAGTLSEWTREGKATRSQSQHFVEASMSTRTEQIAWDTTVGLLGGGGEEEEEEEGGDPDPYYTYSGNRPLRIDVDSGGDIVYSSTRGYKLTETTPVSWGTATTHDRYVSVTSNYHTRHTEDTSSSGHYSPPGVSRTASSSGSYVTSHKWDNSGASLIHSSRTSSTTADLAGYPIDGPYTTNDPGSWASAASEFSNAFNEEAVFAGVDRPLADIAFHPNWNLVKSFNTTHGDLFVPRTPGQMLLANLIAPKGPGQGDEFDRWLDKGKLYIADLLGLRESDKNPAKIQGDNQAAIAAADAGKPVNGSQAKGVSPNTDKTTGQNGPKSDDQEPLKHPGEAGVSNKRADDGEMQGGDFSFVAFFGPKVVTRVKQIVDNAGRVIGVIRLLFRREGVIYTRDGVDIPVEEGGAEGDWVRPANPKSKIPERRVKDGRIDIPASRVNHPSDPSKSFDAEFVIDATDSRDGDTSATWDALNAQMRNMDWTDKEIDKWLDKNKKNLVADHVEWYPDRDKHKMRLVPTDEHMLYRHTGSWSARENFRSLLHLAVRAGSIAAAIKLRDALVGKINYSDPEVQQIVERMRKLRKNAVYVNPEAKRIELWDLVQKQPIRKDIVGIAKLLGRKADGDARLGLDQDGVDLIIDLILLGDEQVTIKALFDE